MKKSLVERPDEIDPRKYLAPACKAVRERAREKIRLFKSNDRIDSSGRFRSPPR